MKKIDDQIREKLQKAYDSVNKKDENRDTEMNPPEYVMNEKNGITTNVHQEELKTINQELLQWPEDFNVFPKLARILKRREASLKEKEKLTGHMQNH